MNYVNCRWSIMTSPILVGREYVELFWINSKVVEGKVYPSRKVVHCNKVRYNYFVFKFDNVLNGEIPLSSPNEETKTLGESSFGMSFLS